jgi:hypothetical protein
VKYDRGGGLPVFKYDDKGVSDSIQFALTH